MINSSANRSPHPFKIYAFRSCYTGVVAGGDTHLQGFLLWITKKTSSKTFIIQPRDSQHRASNIIPAVITVREYSFPRIYKPYSLIFILRAFTASLLVRIKSQANENVLIASSHFFPDVFPVFIQKILKPKTVAVTYIYHVVEDSGRTTSFSNSLANIQERLCFFLIKHFFDGVIVDNKNVKVQLHKRDFKLPILVSSNFVDCSKIAPSPLKLYTLVFCGRLVKQKGIYDFLEVAEELQKINPNFKAAMIGAGPETEKVKSIVLKKRLNVEIVGYVDEKTKYKIISQSKLFLFPSYEEGWGIVIAEALAAGVPVLAYDLPVYGEVFPSHVNVVEKGNVVSLITQAALLLKDDLNTNELVNYAKQFDVNIVSAAEYAFISGLRKI